MISLRIKLKQITVTLAVICFSVNNVCAQKDSLIVNDTSNTFNPQRAKLVIIGSSTAYVAGMSILYSTWYRNYPQSNFHFFNDSKEWLQMDKLGHIGSAYYLSRWSSAMVNWTGLSQKKSAIIGTAIGYGFQLTIEVFDGFSAQWGFSPSDIIANTIGSGLFLSQELIWKEQRITFKYSYHESGLAKYNPNLLGSTINERILKDYNGQTYWLSFNVHSFLNEESKFPRWLNVAVGYGADGLLGAEENALSYNGKIVPVFERQRQLYFSPDIDLSKIKSQKKWVKSITTVFGFLKIPAPAIEFNSKGKVNFKPFYF